MKYAFYPGCVAKSSATELYDSTLEIARKLDIELVELTAASCCGAGVQSEENEFLNVALNARTFAQAEEMGLDIVTICSTCQGVMCQAKKQLEDEAELLAKTNKALAEVNMEYKGKVGIKHLLWALIEDYGLKKLEEKVVRPLTGLKVAPFYGCYILRPEEALGFDDHEKPTSLEKLIAALGGETVHYDGETKCCGFPILFVQQGTALSMAAEYLDNAKRAEADFVVTPCPLCHLSLDTYQRKAEKKANLRVELPIVHLSQLVGMALGVEPQKLGFNKHMVPIEKVLQKWKR